MPAVCRVPRTRTAPTCKPSSGNGSHPPCPPAAPVAAPPTVPDWLRTDWSETAFTIPSFHGASNPGAQLAWAAKNATVAVHDAFACGAWDHIADRRGAVDLAVCDVVLQRYVRLDGPG